MELLKEGPLQDYKCLERRRVAERCPNNDFRGRCYEKPSFAHSTIGYVATAYRTIRHIRLRIVRLDTLHLHTVHVDISFARCYEKPSFAHRSIGHCCFWTPYTILHNLKYTQMYVEDDIFYQYINFLFKKNDFINDFINE